MSILAIDDLKSVGKNEGFGTEISTGKSVFVLSKRASGVRDSIGELTMGKTIHFVTAAQWAMHDLLEYLLSVTGPAQVYMTMYSVSEDPARVINKLKREGLITHLAGLVDWHVKRDKSRAFQAVEQCFNIIGFQNVHAKVIALQNADWSLCVVASCNFNKNKRFEAGVLTASDEGFRFHRNWILQEIRKCNSTKTS